MSTMLRSRKNRHECTYGCCGERVADKTFRAREAQALQLEVAAELAELADEQYAAFEV
jgi:hypothetical protein